MKTILMGILAVAVLFPVVARGSEVVDYPFIETESWWNLYFTQEDNPLRRGSGSVNAVKIIDVDEIRPSWVRIAFPEKREDHFSIFGAASKANDSEDVSIEEALAEWEPTISEWKTMWVNLRFVVSMTRVGSDGRENE